MADHNPLTTLAIYSFAVHGFLNVLAFILRGSMDEAMSLLRKGRVYYLEIKSWKNKDLVRMAPPKNLTG